MMALVSFQSHVNTSEYLHSGSGLNSCRSHVISPLGGTKCLNSKRIGHQLRTNIFSLLSSVLLIADVIDIQLMDI